MNTKEKKKIEQVVRRNEFVAEEEKTFVMKISKAKEEKERGCCEQISRQSSGEKMRSHVRVRMRGSRFVYIEIRKSIDRTKFGNQAH